MLRPFLPVFALLLGTAFMLAGNGLHSLLLPLRGTLEQFSTGSLGLLGTVWASGFVLGCLFTPRLVRRAGHVRAFGAFCAAAAIIALMTGLLIDPIAWILLRGFTGFAMAGAFMIIESWLNERATNETRGTIFSLYMMVTYAGLVGGQMTVAAGDLASQSLFMVTGILYCMALLPTALSTAVSPSPLTTVSLDLKSLFRNSPVAFAAVFLIGIANGAWGTLGAVFGAEAGLSRTAVAVMMSIAIAAGALVQVPVGRLSDRMDRRYVLAGAALVAGATGLVLVVLAPQGVATLYWMTALYGAMSYALYPVAVAHANDHAAPEAFVKVSGGLLLLYGFGTIVGPTVGGFVMGWSGPFSLFAVTGLAHLAIGAYAILRSFRRAAIPAAEREVFQTLPSVRAATPEALRLDPRAEPALETA